MKFVAFSVTFKKGEENKMKNGKNNKTSLRLLWGVLKEFQKDDSIEIAVVFKKKGALTLMGVENGQVANEEMIRRSLFRVVTRN